MFDQLTPPERAEVMDAVNERDRRMDLRFGLIAAQIENCSPHRGQGPASQPGDFFRYGAVPDPSVPTAAEERFVDRPLMRMSGVR